MRALTLTTRQREAYTHHRAGLAPTQIAAAMGVSTQRVRAILRRVGVDAHRQKSPPGLGKRPKPQRTRAQVSERMTQRRAQVRAILSSHPTITARAARDHLPHALRAAVATITADIHHIRQELTP